jgi:hypothetical protein
MKLDAINLVPAQVAQGPFMWLAVLRVYMGIFNGRVFSKNAWIKELKRSVSFLVYWLCLYIISADLSEFWVIYPTLNYIVER